MRSRLIAPALLASLAFGCGRPDGAESPSRPDLSVPDYPREHDPLGAGADAAAGDRAKRSRAFPGSPHVGDDHYVNHRSLA